MMTEVDLWPPHVHVHVCAHTLSTHVERNLSSNGSPEGFCGCQAFGYFVQSQILLLPLKVSSGPWQESQNEKKTSVHTQHFRIP